MKLQSFAGINNVADSTRLAPGEFVSATNIDILGRGSVKSRLGRRSLAEGSAHSVYESAFGIFAVVDSDLMLFDSAGTELRLVYETIGYTRVWYVTLPDGRVAFSNGLINGLASAAATQPWGVPEPVDAGTGIAGGTPYQVTYVRTSDGLEGAPADGALIDTTQAIIGLPVLAGYTINVYFAPYGEEMFLAGSTATDTFQHDGSPLGVTYDGSGLGTPPAGTQLALWNSRVLVADGSTLWATSPFNPEQCDLTKDFLQFEGSITGVYGTSSGVFVGAGNSVSFLSGDALRDLKRVVTSPGTLSVGSIVEIDLGYLPEKQRPQGSQRGALCLIDGHICLLTGEGQITNLTAGRYRNAMTEVYATARLRDGVLQYVAAPA